MNTLHKKQVTNQITIRISGISGLVVFILWVQKLLNACLNISQIDIRIINIRKDIINQMINQIIVFRSISQPVGLKGSIIIFFSSILNLYNINYSHFILFTYQSIISIFSLLSLVYDIIYK